MGSLYAKFSRNTRSIFPRTAKRLMAYSTCQLSLIRFAPRHSGCNQHSHSHATQCAQGLITHLRCQIPHMQDVHASNALTCKRRKTGITLRTLQVQAVVLPACAIAACHPPRLPGLTDPSEAHLFDVNPCSRPCSLRECSQKGAIRLRYTDLPESYQTQCAMCITWLSRRYGDKPAVPGNRGEGPSRTSGLGGTRGCQAEGHLT